MRREESHSRPHVRSEHVVPQGLKFDSSLRHARSRGVRRRRHQEKVFGRTWNGMRERKDVFGGMEQNGCWMLDVGCGRGGGVILPGPEEEWGASDALRRRATARRQAVNSEQQQPGREGKRPAMYS